MFVFLVNYLTCETKPNHICLKCEYLDLQLGILHNMQDIASNASFKLPGHHKLSRYLIYLVKNSNKQCFVT